MKDTKYPFRKHIFFWHLVQEKPNKTNKTPQRQEYKLTSVKASKEDANPYSKFRKRIKKESIVQLVQFINIDRGRLESGPITL